MLEIVRRDGGDLRPAARRARTRRASTTAASSTRGPTIARWRSCSRRRSSAGRRGWSCASSSTSRRGARSTRGQAGLLRRSAKLDEETPRRPRPRDRHAARGDSRRRSARDRRRRPRELERLLRAEEQWHDLADHLAVDAGARRRTRASATTVALRLADVLRDASSTTSRRRRSLRRGPRAHARAAARRSPRSSAWRRSGRPPLSRRRDPRAGLPAGGRLRQAGRARSTPSSRPSTTATERVRILREMAEIYQRLGALDLAFDCRSRAWLADVELGARRWRRWRRSASAGGLHGPLVGDAQKGAVEASDPDLQAQLWAHDGAAARGARSATRARRSRPGASALAARPDDLRRVPGARAAAVGGRALGRARRGAGEAPRDHHRRRRAQGDREAHRRALRGRAQAARAGGARLGDRARDRRQRRRGAGALAQLHLAGGVVPRARRGLRAQDRARRAPRASGALLSPAERAHLYDEKLGRGRSGGRASCARLLDESARRSRRRWTALDRIFTARGAARRSARGARLRAAGREATPAARDELAFRAARLTETELSDVEAAIARYQGDPRGDAGARRDARGAVGRSRAATTTACRRSRRWSPVLRARQRLGRGRRARSSCASRSRTRSAARLAIAGRDCAHRGDASGAMPTGPSPPGRARSPRRRPRPSPARGAGAAGRGERRLRGLADGLRGAHGGDVRRVAAALAGAAAGRAVREPARRPGRARRSSCARR